MNGPQETPITPDELINNQVPLPAQKKKFPKIYLVLIPIFFIFFLAIFFIRMNAQQEKIANQEKADINKEQFLSEPMSEWQTYKDPEFGFSISHPSSWKVSAETLDEKPPYGYATVYMPSLTGDSAVDTALTIWPNKNYHLNSSLEELAEQSFREITYDPIQPITINGSKGVVLRNLYNNVRGSKDDASDIYFMGDINDDIIYRIDVEKVSDPKVQEYIYNVLSTFSRQE